MPSDAEREAVVGQLEPEGKTPFHKSLKAKKRRTKATDLGSKASPARRRRIRRRPSAVSAGSSASRAAAETPGTWESEGEDVQVKE